MGQTQGARAVNGPWATVAAILCTFPMIGLSPVSAQQNAQPGTTFNRNCASSTACIAGANSSTGQGVAGRSTKGAGVYGATTFNSTPTQSASGIFGIDLSTSGTGNVGVFGVSPSGVGMRGTSTSGSGMLGQSTSAAGVVGTSASFAGVEGVTGFLSPNSTNAAGVAGYDNSTNGTTNFGVFGGSANGIGIEGSSTHSFGIWGKTSDLGGPHAGVAGQAGDHNGASYAFWGVDDTKFPIFSVDSVGNVRISGLLFSVGSCSNGCSRPRHGMPGRSLGSYAPREAAPTMEDSGEAQMIRGEAAVRLDPQFANGIDQRSRYLVFITPEGDSRGLFVTDQSMKGFTVRENQNGRSTLAFNYRIVAKPYGVTAQRLPMVTTNALPNGPSGRPRFASPAIAPKG